MRNDLILTSNCDGLPLSVTVIAPNQEIRGIFQISHGMAEHKSRYYPFMEFLAENGYAAVINDHRGHGKSVSGPEDLGYFYDNTAEYITEDLHQVTEYAKTLYPGKEVILFGHSMGSMVVRKYIKKYDSEISKLIVSGSPSKNPLIEVIVPLVKLIAAVRGGRYVSRIINQLTFGSYNRRFAMAAPDTISKNAWICANEDIVKAYDADRLCGFTFTLNGFENLFGLMRDIYSRSGWAVNNPSLPVFFIAGSDDPVIISKRKWLESQLFLKSVGYKNLRCKLYKGLRHEILNECCCRKIYADILNLT